MELKSMDISPFLDGEGRVVQLPKKQAKRLAVLNYLAQKFQPGRIYTEREVNDLCLRWHTFDDYFLVRRSLVEGQLLARRDDGSAYWRPAPEETEQTDL